MSALQSLPYTAPLELYERQAAALFQALQSGDDAARWHFKWEHPRYRGQPVGAVDAAALELVDAQIVIAHDYGFETWAELAAFTDAVHRDPAVAQFEAAVEAVVEGDLATLQALLGMSPGLVRARSTRRHHATLLHYLGANGAEGGRQRTPKNAVAVAEALLIAGAEPDALADMYDEKCTTMSMLVSSNHPADVALQAPLAEMLLDHGAALEGLGSKWTSPLMTALVFGYLETARVLARRGARVEHLPAAAGLGLMADVARSLATATDREKHAALALASQLGHADVVRLLLDAGEDPNRNNPPELHAHATPLHQAVAGDHLEVVRLLVERGARLDVRDTLYDGTPLGWAIYCGRPEIAAYLRGRGAA